MVKFRSPSTDQVVKRGRLRLSVGSREAKHISKEDGKAKGWRGNSEVKQELPLLQAPKMSGS